MQQPKIRKRLCLNTQNQTTEADSVTYNTKEINSANSKLTSQTTQEDTEYYDSA